VSEVVARAPEASALLLLFPDDDVRAP